MPLPTPPNVALKTLPGVGLVLGNEDGLTFYTYDQDTVPGQSSCRGECAKSWAPVAAGADAKPFGEWSLVKSETGRDLRIDGENWVAGDKDEPEEVVADVIVDSGDVVWHGLLLLLDVMT